MIGFRRRTFWESIRYRFDRGYRESVDARREEAIRWLVQHPEAPCAIQGNVIPDGYGNNCLRPDYLRQYGYPLD